MGMNQYSDQPRVRVARRLPQAVVSLPRKSAVPTPPEKTPLIPREEVPSPPVDASEDPQAAKFRRMTDPAIEDQVRRIAQEYQFPEGIVLKEERSHESYRILRMQTADGSDLSLSFEDAKLMHEGIRKGNEQFIRQYFKDTGAISSVVWWHDGMQHVFSFDQAGRLTSRTDVHDGCISERVLRDEEYVEIERQCVPQ